MSRLSGHLISLIEANLLLLQFLSVKPKVFRVVELRIINNRMFFVSRFERFLAAKLRHIIDSKISTNDVTKLIKQL